MWLLYGANGTTGTLFLQTWQQRWPGAPPILAGRSELALKSLAQAYDLPYLCFELSQLSQVKLPPLGLIVNLAGPYMDTAQPWLEYCQANRLSYIDISGEWRTFERIYAQAEAFYQAGIAVITAAGFDTVAGEASLTAFRRRYPQASVLRLSIYAEGGFSAGTAQSAFRMLPAGFFCYEAGHLVPWKGTQIITLPDARQHEFRAATLAELITFPAWQPVQRLETYVAIPPRYSHYVPFVEKVFVWQPFAQAVEYLIRQQRSRLASQMDLAAPSFLHVESPEAPERLFITTQQAYLFTVMVLGRAIQAYFEQGVKPGVASAYARYGDHLLEGLSWHSQWQHL